MIRYSLKQMLRSRLKTFMFFLLLAGSACLLALGINLWDMNRRSIREFEQLFSTIGTVQQKQHDQGLKVYWSEYSKKNVYTQDFEYGRLINDEELIFDGAEYINAPKQRPYFGADMSYLTDYPSFDGLMEEHYFTAEVVPLEDYDGKKPIRIEIVKSYAESYQDGETLSFFHYDDLRLEAGKRYMASLQLYSDVDGDGEYEFCLSHGLATSQYDKDGNRKKGFHEDIQISEVTEGFFETEIGKCWLEQSKAIQKFQDILPVTPVDDINLIMAFYEQRAYIKEGRMILPEEYEQGANVCLISSYLANQLQLKIGDNLRLPLFYASYSETPAMNFGMHGGGFGFCLLNADGKMYETFDDQTYEVVGIYDLTSNPVGDYALTEIEVFIPYNAVKGSWDNHIVSFGPMNVGNTTFEIENGTIDEFLEKWNQQEFAEELEVTFYDKGYTEFEREIESRKMMSNIFLISGLLLSVIILIFFCNLFIMGQRQKITVERILGLSRRECCISSLAGLLLIATAGIGIGSVSGWLLTKQLSEQLSNTISYDTLYSITMVQTAVNDSYGIINGSFWTAVSSMIILMILVLAIAGGYLKDVLKDTPLTMLGKLED